MINKLSKFKYHHHLIKLLLMTESIQEKHINSMSELKANYDYLPDSMREFYQIYGIEGTYKKLTKGWILHDLSPHDAEIKQCMIHLITDRDGIIGIYAKLDGSADPSIFNNNNEWESDLNQVNWYFMSKTFSSFMFYNISRMVFDGWSFAGRIDGVSTSEDLSFLEELENHLERFTSTQPVSSNIVDYFYSKHGIVCIEYLADKTLNWEIHSANNKSLYYLLKPIWHILRHSVDQFEAKGSNKEIREKVNIVLRTLSEEMVT